MTSFKQLVYQTWEASEVKCGVWLHGLKTPQNTTSPPFTSTDFGPLPVTVLLDMVKTLMLPNRGITDETLISSHLICFPTCSCALNTATFVFSSVCSVKKC